MSGEGMSSTDSEKGSKLPWYKSLRIEGRFPKEQLVVILGGYNAGYTMRYFKPSIRWLMIAKDNVWSPKKFSDDKTISMRELYHVIYCRNLPIKYMLSMIVPVIFSLSAALLSLMGLRGKKHCTMRRLQSALFAIYSLLLLFVQIPLVVHLNEHSTIGGSSPFRYTDEQLWSLFNYISAVTALMSVVLFGAITLQFAAILMCHDKCRRDE